MDRTARERAVRAFTDTTPERVRVMLMTLKMMRSTLPALMPIFNLSRLEGLA